MKIIIEYFSRIFFGKSNENNLEKRVFISASTITFIGALIGMIWNLLLGMPMKLSLLVGFFMLLYFLLYFNARFKNKYHPIAYVLVSLVFLSLLYIFNGGLNGSIPSLYIVFILVFVTICNSKYQSFIIIVTITNLMGLFVLERLFLGSFINNYIDNKTREMDLAFGYLAALILCFIIINYFKKTITSKNNQLNNLNKSKDLLFNIIAHDLRSPFHSILGFADIMTDKSEELTKAEFQEYAEIINEKSHKTLDLLESLLEWGKIHMDNIQFNPQVINLNQNVNEIILLFRNDYKQKNIKITNSISNDIMVNVDQNILNTIFRNLLSNSIKFTPNGGEIHISAQEYNKNKFLIIVQDSGIGMDKQISENLFQFDINSNRNGTEGEKSMGLGLIITKELIEKLGETLIVESESNKGSKFKFTLSKF